MQGKKTILAIDIGTSSLKAGLIDEEGRLLAFERERFVKEKPAKMWLEAFCLCAKKIFQEQNHKIPTAISISGNGPTLAFVHSQKNGELAPDILLWNAPLSEAGSQNYQGKSLFIPRILAYFASFSDSIQTIEKLRSIKKIFSGPEYLVWQLTGIAHTLLPEPRFQAAYWTDEELESYGIAKHLLPPFITIGTQSGSLKNEFFSIFGLTKEEALEIPVFCAGPDFTSAIIGTNTLEPGKICDRAGSSEGFNLCTEWPLSNNTNKNAPPYSQIRNLPSIMSPYFNASTLIPDSGIRFSKMKKQSSFAQKTYSEYVAFLLKNKDEAGYKTMIDLALECKLVFDVLFDSFTKEAKKQNSNIEIERKMVVTGGQAKNEAWLRLKAKIMDVTILVPSCLDAELIGNAAIAFWGLKVYNSLPEALKSLASIKMIIKP